MLAQRNFAPNFGDCHDAKSSGSFVEDIQMSNTNKVYPAMYRDYTLLIKAQIEILHRNARVWRWCLLTRLSSFLGSYDRGHKSSVERDEGWGLRSA
jgi:hypothetical protein